MINNVNSKYKDDWMKNVEHIFGISENKNSLKVLIKIKISHAPNLISRNKKLWKNSDSQPYNISENPMWFSLYTNHDISFLLEKRKQSLQIFPLSDTSELREDHASFKWLYYKCADIYCTTLANICENSLVLLVTFTICLKINLIYRPINQLDFLFYNALKNSGKTQYLWLKYTIK